MAINFNNGSNPAEVKFHNQGTVNDITAVNFNGTQIWRKVGWRNAWSGMAYLFDTEELEEMVMSWDLGEYDFTHEFTDMSIPDASQYTTQVDAEFHTFDIGDPDPNYAISSDYLTAERNDNSEVTNLPWNAYGYTAGTLDPLAQDGSSTTITAYSDMFYLWGAFLFGGFVITNIWYYDK